MSTIFALLVAVVTSALATSEVAASSTVESTTPGIISRLKPELRRAGGGWSCRYDGGCDVDGYVCIWNSQQPGGVCHYNPPPPATGCGQDDDCGVDYCCRFAILGSHSSGVCFYCGPHSGRRLDGHSEDKAVEWAPGTLPTIPEEAVEWAPGTLPTIPEEATDKPSLGWSPGLPTIPEERRRAGCEDGCDVDYCCVWDIVNGNGHCLYCGPAPPPATGCLGKDGCDVDYCCVFSVVEPFPRVGVCQYCGPQSGRRLDDHSEDKAVEWAPGTLPTIPEEAVEWAPGTLPTIPEEAVEWAPGTLPTIPEEATDKPLGWSPGLPTIPEERRRAEDKSVEWAPGTLPTIPEEAVEWAPGTLPTIPEEATDKPLGWSPGLPTIPEERRRASGKKSYSVLIPQTPGLTSQGEACSTNQDCVYPDGSPEPGVYCMPVYYQPPALPGRRRARGTRYSVGIPQGSVAIPQGSGVCQAQSGSSQGQGSLCSNWSNGISDCNACGYEQQYPYSWIQQQHCVGGTCQIGGYCNAATYGNGN